MMRLDSDKIMQRLSRGVDIANGDQIVGRGRGDYG